ncbi:DMT family transporter [Paenarthrobacter ureafaciens]|uniref:DMT family transporter n=1 Tax=Paenarthrobacter ureafaciens TaxID=37931 RepID=UPI0009AE6BE1|nr:multidrug efflux SMR transporter [Paenarthrobacter ureafaciens]
MGTPTTAKREARIGVSWLVLLASAVLEAVWATALGLSNGFTELIPTLVFAVTATLSMLGLGIAVKRIPLGTAYAVWVGIGAALTVGWAMVTGVEPASPLKLLFIAGIVGCAAGLKALPADQPADMAATSAE